MQGRRSTAKLYRNERLRCEAATIWGVGYRFKL